MERPDYYYEDLEIGAKFMNPGRTVTEADVVNFAGLSGDFMAIHVNREVGRQTIFGQNIAHGLCTLSIVSGLIAQTGLLSRVMAFLNIQDWNFSAPVFFGDTVCVMATVTDRHLTSKKDRGIVTVKIQVINQREEVVQRGNWLLMVATRIADKQ